MPPLAPSIWPYRCMFAYDKMSMTEELSWFNAPLQPERIHHNVVNHSRTCKISYFFATINSQVAFMTEVRVRSLCALASIMFEDSKD